MSLTLYGLKNCDTCKKAIKALEAAGKPVTFVDIRADTDMAAKAPVWLEAVGADKLLNTRSTTWRSLSEDERAGDPAALLIAHPTLAKRPVIEAGDTVYVSWSKEVQAALL